MNIINEFIIDAIDFLQYSGGSCNKEDVVSLSNKIYSLLRQLDDDEQRVFVEMILSRYATAEDKNTKKRFEMLIGHIFSNGL